jgi:hypothetical protein
MIRVARWIIFWGMMPLAALLAAQPPAPPPTTTRPASAPADVTMDWLLSQSSTAPSTPVESSTTAPSTMPSVFSGGAGAEGRDATLLLSNGRKIFGKFATTPGEPIRIFDTGKQEYRDLPLKIIKSMQANVLWERLEPEWKFKESGSDVKEYSGKTYPARETEYVVTLENGDKITGGIAAPIYQQTPDGDKLFILHKRDKGEPGQSLTDLVFIKRIDFAE